MYKGSAAYAKIGLYIELNISKYLVISSSKKVPKHENFQPQFFTPSKPIWICDFGTGKNNLAKKNFGASYSLFCACTMRMLNIRIYVLCVCSAWLLCYYSARFDFLGLCWANATNISPVLVTSLKIYALDVHALKIITRMLSIHMIRFSQIYINREGKIKKPNFLSP